MILASTSAPAAAIATQPAPSTTMPTEAHARALLVRAENYAGSASNAKDAATVRSISLSIKNARKAAAMLLVAEPRTKFQDLKFASKLAQEGADALTNALDVFKAPATAPLGTLLRPYLDTALRAFDGAFEILDND